MRAALLALPLLAALQAGPALAQSAPTSSEAARAVIGAWEISNADRDRTCAVVFKADPVPGGLKIEFDRACAAVFPVTRDVVAWTVGTNEALRLLDSRGRTLLEFTEVESGMYEGERPGEGLYFLQSAGAGPNWRTAEEMFGDWGLVRGTGRPICVLTLSNAAAGGQETYALRLKPNCDALVTRFGPTTWRMDRGELVVSSPRGQSWRFEEGDSSTWKRVPETADGLALVKQ
jgi:Protease inhibitor Inh